MNNPNYNLPADAPERRGTAESQRNSKLKSAHTPISDADGNQIGYSTSKTDSKGRVLRQTELIAKDLEPLLKQRHSPDYPIQDLQLLAYELATYVLEQKYQAYAHDVSLGVDMGRKEAGAMFVSAFEAEMNKVLEGALPAWADETLDMAKRAVEAMSKSMEEKDEQKNSIHDTAAMPTLRRRPLRKCSHGELVMSSKTILKCPNCIGEWPECPVCSGSGEIAL